MKTDGAAFVRNTRGATTLEFALLALPFIAVIFVSLQTGVVFFFDQALQTATKQAARQLMTGTDQDAGISQAQFKNSICAKVNTFTCSNLMVDVESGSSFSSINSSNIPLTYNASNQVTNTWSYNPGGPGDIVIVRVMYLWPIFGGPLAANLANQPNSEHLLMATYVFKNEPYT